MEPVRLVRLLHAYVMAGSLDASGVAGFEQTACDVSCLVCQHLFTLEENSRNMVALLRQSECAW